MIVVKLLHKAEQWPEGKLFYVTNNTPNILKDILIGNSQEATDKLKIQIWKYVL